MKTAALDAVAGTLSGGNQQKVVLAKWLAANPKVLIIDEPTRGIDVGTKSEVHRMMSELAGMGLAILMISSELPEVLGMADRVLVMREGQLTATIDRAEATRGERDVRRHPRIRGSRMSVATATPARVSRRIAAVVSGQLARDRHLPRTGPGRVIATTVQ